jgi:general stress protein CsbA
MNPDLTRTLAATAFVAAIIALVLLGASGCREFAAYVACVCFAILSAFIGSTQQI